MLSNHLMNSFENTINYIRDILRKEGITGMDSIKHCIIFIFMKYLNKNTCQLFNMSEIYSFENIIKLDHLRMLESVYFKGNECLINLLKKYSIFNVDFKIKSSMNLENILKKIDTIDIQLLSTQSDLVGLIYELHLKTGTSQAMRDLGQYFTSRNVIEYMVDLCKPTYNNKTKKIETILDPSMGTGGFLVMAIKYLNNNYKDINWNKNKNNIYGFDVDENVKSMALLNTFIETGYLFDKTIIQHNTLENDLLLEDETFINKVDIILANEPFGLKNIIHANCCDRVKKLKIRGTKSEPLFLQLMLTALNVNGRCAVIVPDGVLFNNSNLHSETRKYLIENFNLIKVISLNGDYFINTNVKSSILFFINNGKTKETEFIDLILDNSKLKENLIIKVDYKTIVNNGYSLFINKFIIPKEIKIYGIEYKKLGEICDFLPKSKRQASYGKDIGIYPFYTSSQDLTKYCNEADYNEESIIIGDGGNPNIHFNKMFSCSDHNYILKLKNIITNINIKYIYYYFLVNLNKIENGFKGSTIKNISKSYIESLEIPIPTLEKQEQIIEILDVFYEQIERNIKSIDAYEKIKKSIILINTQHNCDNKKLGDISNYESKVKKLKASDGNEKGLYPFYTSSNKILYRDDYEFNKYQLIIGRGGNSCIFYDINFGISHDDIFILGSEKYNLEYIYHYLKNNFELIINNFKGSTIKHINKENLNNIIYLSYARHFGFVYFLYH
jgi:type I restriction-modification system DNA methylase subunit/restriction endonuclease S subunit